MEEKSIRSFSTNGQDESGSNSSSCNRVVQGPELSNSAKDIPSENLSLDGKEECLHRNHISEKFSKGEVVFKVLTVNHGDGVTKDTGMVNTREDYEKKGYDVNRCFLLPFKMMDRFKLLVQVLKDMTDITNCGKVFGICDHLDFEIKRLIQSLVYLSNSTSFEKGNKYYDFDKLEIDRKLGRKRNK